MSLVERAPEAPVVHPAAQEALFPVPTEVSAQQAIDAFMDLYTEAFYKGGDDAIDALERTKNQLPKAHEFGVAKGLQGIAPALYATALTMSIVPASAYFTYATAREFKNRTSHERILHENANGLTRLLEASKKFGQTIGLSCVAWKVNDTGELLLEMPMGASEADDRAIMERVSFLSTALRESGNADKCRGFMLTKDTLENNGLDATAIRNKTALLTPKLYYLMKDGEQVIVQHEDVPASPNIAPHNTHAHDQLLDAIAKLEPNHPLIRARKQGNDNTMMARIAQASLADRLATVYRNEQSGRRTQSHVTVLPHVILDSRDDGSVQMVPSPKLITQLEQLTHMSPQAALEALEYTFYKRAAEDHSSFVDGHLELPEIKQAVVSHHTKNKGGSVVLTYAFEDEGPYHIHCLSDRRKSESRPWKTAAKLGFLGLLGLHSMGLAHANKHPYDQPNTSLLITPQEQQIGRQIGDHFRSIDNAILTLANLKHESDDLWGTSTPHRPELIDSDDRGAAASGHEPGTDPMWYISAAPNTDITGYWEQGRYDRLELDPNNYFEWQTTPPYELLHDAYPGQALDELDELDPRRLEVTPSSEAISIYGNVAPRSDYTTFGGNWQAIYLPVLQGRTVIAASAELTNIDQAHQNSPTITRLLHTDAGTILFMKLPTLISYDDYFKVTYKIDTVDQSSPVNAKSGIRSAIPAPGKEKSLELPFDAGADQAANFFPPADALAELQSYDYHFYPILANDEDGNGFYDLGDMAQELHEAQQATCFESNSVFAAVSEQNISPVFGFLLSQDDVAADDTHNGGMHYLGEQDAHLFTVDEHGTIFDATPWRSTDDTSVLTHSQLTGTFDNGMYFAREFSSTLKREQPKSQSKGEAIERLLGAAGVYIAGAAAVAYRKRRRKAFTNPANVKSHRAARLASIAIYKLDGSNTRHIRADDLASVSVPDYGDIVGESPKTLRKKLASDRQASRSTPMPYTRRDARQAVRLVRELRRQRR